MGRLSRMREDRVSSPGFGARIDERGLKCEGLVTCISIVGSATVSPVLVTQRLLSRLKLRLT